MAAISAYPPLAELRGRDLLSSADLNGEQTQALLQLATDLKTGRSRIDLAGKTLGLIFSKPSTRTRVSFSVAMARLGGQTIDLNPQVSQVGRGEPVADTARVLSRYVDALAIRTFAQDELEEYAGSNAYLKYLCYQYVKIKMVDLCTEPTPFFEQDYTKFTCEAYKLNKLTGLKADNDGVTYAYPNAFCPYPTSYYSVEVGDFGEPAPKG
ncbi:MAG: hypothetical protein NWR94_00770, partial [Cyanobium sp. MAG_237]|nr:hypothetical protein [Cyanobium sp. MAG_237]